MRKLTRLPQLLYSRSAHNFITFGAAKRFYSSESGKLETESKKIDDTTQSTETKQDNKQKNEKPKSDLIRPPRFFKAAILLVGAQLIYNVYYLWKGWDITSQESLDKLASSNEADVVKELDDLVEMLYEKCNRCEGCINNKACNYFPENHSLFVERMYTGQIGKYLPPLIEHPDTQISRKALAVLVSLFKYDHIVIQAIDHGLTSATLNVVVQDRGTETLFSVLNSLIARKKMVRHVMRDEKALQIIRQLTEKDMLGNITFYFIASIVVNKAFHPQVVKMKEVAECVNNLAKSKDPVISKDSFLMKRILRDEVDMYEEHINDFSSVDPESFGHEGKGSASFLLSAITFGTTYIYCLQRWKRLTPDMLFIRTKSIVGAAGAVLCMLNFFHYNLPPSDKTLLLVDENLRFLELQAKSTSPSHPLLTPHSPHSLSTSVPRQRRSKQPVYNWYVSPWGYFSGLALVVGSRYYVLLAWYYSRYTVLPSLAFSALAVLIRDRWSEVHFRIG